MEEKRELVLFLLLLTLSAVMGVDFAFSKEAYEGILHAEHENDILFTNAKVIQYFNVEHDEELLWERPIGNHGLHLVSRNIVDEDDKAGILQVEPYRKETLKDITIVFAKVTHSGVDYVFGILHVCFVQSEVGYYHESCLRTFAFSPPRNEEDERLAKAIAKRIDLPPLSEEEITNLSEGRTFTWNLSCLKEILSSPLKEYVQGDSDSVFDLKPIILDEDLLNQYFALGHPDGSVEDFVPA